MAQETIQKPALFIVGEYAPDAEAAARRALIPNSFGNQVLELIDATNVLIIDNPSDRDTIQDATEAVLDLTVSPPELRLNQTPMYTMPAILGHGAETLLIDTVTQQEWHGAQQLVTGVYTGAAGEELLCNNNSIGLISTE